MNSKIAVGQTFPDFEPAESRLCLRAASIRSHGPAWKALIKPYITAMPFHANPCDAEHNVSIGATGAIADTSAIDANVGVDAR
jgi:hypothetical protein